MLVSVLYVNDMNINHNVNVIFVGNMRRDEWTYYIDLWCLYLCDYYSTSLHK